MFSEGEGVDATSLSLDLIKAWPVFPSKMNRSKLPGFYTHWFIGEDFEALYSNFSTLYPDSSASIDKVSLMAVWLTMRLPYHVDIDLLKNTDVEQTSPAP